MDAIVMLKDDHKRVERLFKRYEKLGEEDAEEKQAVVAELVEELTTHAYIEETLFYPEARQAVPETEDHVLESVEEHHVVVWLMSELTKLTPDDERYDAKVAVLMENVRHHVEEEEQEWFPQVRKGLGRKRLQELGERMERARADAPRDPLDLRSAETA